MAHAVKRFSKSVLNEPQFIIEHRLEEITNYLEHRSYGDYIKAHEEATLMAERMKDKDSENDYRLAETTVGLLRVEGNLTYKPTIFSALCGGTDYSTLIEQTKELCSMDSIDTILMEVDSGGGLAFRMMETSREIKRLCNESGKKLICYVDGTSASAAFGLSVAADEIIVNPDSMIGSIGAVVGLTDSSAQDEKEGIKRIYISSADSKVPFEEDGSFKKEYLEDVQSRVQELGTKFVNHVAELRGLDTSTVANTNAKMFSAEQALELGLVDKIMEGEEFFNYLSTLSNDNKPAPTKQVNVIKLEKDDHSSSLTTQSVQEENISMSDNQNPELSVEEAKLAELSAMQEKLAAFEAKEAEFAAQADALAKAQEMAEKLAQFEAKEEASKLAELSASLDKFAFLADSKEDVISFLSDSSVKEDHKSLLNSVLEKANASYEEVEAQAAEGIASAQLEAEQVKEEKEKLKAEFGEAENAVAGSVTEPVDFKASLAAKVEKQKAAKAAKKA